MESGSWPMVMLLCFWGNFVIITNQDPNKEDYSRVVESFPIRYHFPCYPASSQNWTFFPPKVKPIQAGCIGRSHFESIQLEVLAVLNLEPMTGLWNPISIVLFDGRYKCHFEVLVSLRVLRVSNVDRVDSSWFELLRTFLGWRVSRF